jgi:hypothetical protein
MKKILAILFVSLLAYGARHPQQPQPAPPLPADAGIEGTIVRFGTAERLSKAVVELQPVSGGTGRQSTTTESDGRFYFPEIVPGNYRLFARRDGHWNAEYGQRWVDGPGQILTIAPGAKLRDIQVVMTPGGVIAGRITNRDGLPMAGARISAMKPWINQNQRQLRSVQDVVANDLGEYRLIWLMPGRYYISATFVDYTPTGAATQLVIDPDAEAGLATGSRSVSRPVTNRPLTSLAEDEVYTPMFFPTTIDSDKAVAIELKQGEEYRGADINVTPVRAFHVRGVVSNLPAPAPPRGAPGAVPPVPAPPQAGGGARGGPPLRVSLAPLTPNGALYNTNANGETGQFDFPKVIAGSYVAYLYQAGMTIRSNIEVRNGDVDGVSLPIASGIDTPVNMTFDGTPPQNLPPIVVGRGGLTPTLWRNPTILNAPSMPVNLQANPPALTNIAPGYYHLYLPPMFAFLSGAMPVAPPPAWQNVYVKSIRLGDRDVLSEGLHLERPSDVPLEIVIGANPGSLQGQVMDDQRQPSVGAVITVFANNPADRIYRTDMYKITSTDTAGRFQFPSLRPGDYRVFAWENVERGTWIDSTFLRIHEDRGVTVRIEEGKPATVSTTVIRP